MALLISSIVHWWCVVLAPLLSNTHTMKQLIKAVVENIGTQKSKLSPLYRGHGADLASFPGVFADNQLLDAMKVVGQALHVDQRVRKKLVAILAAWNQQFKGDPTMAAFIAMHERVSPDPKLRLSTDVANMLGIDPKRDEEMRTKKEEKLLQREIARLEASGVKVERRYIFDFEKASALLTHLELCSYPSRANPRLLRPSQRPHKRPIISSMRSRYVWMVNIWSASANAMLACKSSGGLRGSQ